MHSPPIELPAELVASQRRYGGDSGLAWLEQVADLAAGYLDRWELRRDGPVMHGQASLVLPVSCADETPGVLKLQPVDEESEGEPVGLRVWNGNGSVRLLCADDDSGAMLLERLDTTRPLSRVADEGEAVRALGELLARLTAVPAPTGVRTLAGIADGMLERLPDLLPYLRDPADRRLLRAASAAVRELRAEPGDRLLHWDLHYDNILASRSATGREPWLAIDPKPLAGDPGFDLLPALDNRWEDIRASSDTPAAVRWRFHLLTEILDLDRERARGWTLGRVLQNGLWDIEEGESALHPVQVAIASALLER